MPFIIDMKALRDKHQLVNFLGIEETAFDEILAFIPDSQKTVKFSEDIWHIPPPPFLRHDIPKKNRNRGVRVVWEPSLLMNEYKALARRFNNFFSHELEGFPHPRTFGYVGGVNIRENAQDHCGHKNLLSLDLRDFFPSIHATRIEEFFLRLNIEPPVSNLLSRFVTIGGALPLGLPTSPTIANAICLGLDFELERLAAAYGATFSRYADDISFSNDDELPKIEELDDCIRRNGFEIATSKTRSSKLGQAHYVTGLSVSDPNQPHIPRKKKRRLRQELHYAQKYGLEDHFHHMAISDDGSIQREINRLDGMVKFVAYHEPCLSRPLKTVWENILQESDHQPSFEPKNQARNPFFIGVDEAEFTRPDGQKILALCMAVSSHQDRIKQATSEILNANMADMWAAGDKRALERRGIHFTDVHPDLRLAYIERMRKMPFEGYVAMARLVSAKDYEATYIRLLNSMIKRRLMAAESKHAYFKFEKNEKVSQSAIKSCVMDSFNGLERHNSRRPKMFSVEFSGKPDSDLSVPDFLIAVLGRYLSLKPEKDGENLSRDRLLFERIRDKYRLILDVDNHIEYSRRHQIAPWAEAPQKQA